MLTLLRKKLNAKNKPTNVILKPTQLSGRAKLKLNLGSSCELQSGVVNIDYNPQGFKDAAYVAGAECVVYDLSKGIPADEASTTYIYSSHFYEHLEHFTLKFLLSECFRVLESGGVMRLAMPNFTRLLAAYHNRDEEFFKWAVNENTISHYRVPIEEVKWADVLSLGLYEWGEHKYFYDGEKLIDMLQRAGFIDAKEVDFDPTLDIESRREHTFYLSAIKP